MKLIFTICLLVGCVSLTFAQNIQGSVKDANSDLPLVGASITIDGTLKGIATDEQGNFKIVTDKLPIVVTVSYIGYQSKKVLIESYQIEIRLEVEEEKMSELVITDKPIIEKVFKKNYTIKDYEFYEDFIILLVYKGYFKKHSLILTDKEGNQLSELSIKGWKPIELFAGCLGGVHLLTNSYARQIYILGHSIQFLKKIDTRVFEAQLLPCMDANAKFVFYKISKHASQKVIYLKINKTNPRDKKEIVTVTNEKSLILLEDEPSFQQLRRYALAEHNRGQPVGSTFGDEIANSGFVSSVIFKPIYVPMFEYRDTIYLFDHVYHQILKLDIDGNRVDSTKMNYHLNKKWRKNIIFDQVTGKAYTLLDTKWAMTLHQIDLKTGKLSAPLLLDRPHISNIKIKNGFIYFLYYAPQHGERMQKLEKMRLY